MFPFFLPELCCTKCKDSGPHTGHAILPLGESTKEFKAVLESVIAGLDKATNDLAQIVTSLDEKSVTINSDAAKVRDSIQSAFTLIREAIDARERELLSIVEEKCGQINEEYLDFTQKVNESIRPQLSEDAQAALDNAEDSKDLEALCNLVKETKKYIESTKEIELEWVSFQGREDLITFNGDLSVQSIIDSVNAFNNIRISTDYRAPRDFSLVHAGSSSALLRWNLDKYARKYFVYKKLSGANDFEGTPCWEGDGNECMVLNLAPNSGYNFCVKALYGANGLSKPSSKVVTNTSRDEINSIRIISLNLDCASVCARSLKDLRKDINCKFSYILNVECV